MYQKLAAINPTNSQFNGDSLQHSDIPKFDRFVLREALVNAIVHRDCRAFANGLMVTVYNTRIEFWNAGKLNKNISIEELSRDHHSFPNNPDVAHTYFQQLYGEKWAGNSKNR